MFTFLSSTILQLYLDVYTNRSRASFRSLIIAFFLQFSPLFTFKENFSSAPALFYLDNFNICTANPSSPKPAAPCFLNSCSRAEGSSLSSNHLTDTSIDFHIAVVTEKAPMKWQLAARARQEAFLLSWENVCYSKKCSHVWNAHLISGLLARPQSCPGPFFSGSISSGNENVRWSGDSGTL